MSLQLDSIKNKVAQMFSRYNPEHAIGVDFNYIDSELLDLIDRLTQEVQSLEKTVHRIENNNYVTSDELYGDPDY